MKTDDIEDKVGLVLNIKIPDSKTYKTRSLIAVGYVYTTLYWNYSSLCSAGIEE